MENSETVFFSTKIFINPGSKLNESYPLFDDTNTNNIPNSKFYDEKEYVELFFSKRTLQLEELEQKLKFEPINIITEVIEPFFKSNKEGEIDLIVVNSKIEESISIEFKKFKDKNYNEILIDKKKIHSIIKQCNRNYTMGFHRVYVCVIFDVEGYKKTDTDIFFREVNEIDKQKVLKSLISNGLMDEIGIIFFQYVWLNNKPLGYDYKTEINLIKEAKVQSQSIFITKKLNSLT